MEICAMILHCILQHLSCPEVVALLRPMMQLAGIECWLTCWIMPSAILDERHSPSKWAQKALGDLLQHHVFGSCDRRKSGARDKPGAAHLEHTTWRSSSCYWSLDYGDGARAQARMLSIFFSIPRLCSCRLWCVPLGEDLGCCRGAFSPSSRSEIGQASGVLHRKYHGQRGCSMITW